MEPTRTIVIEPDPQRRSQLAQTLSASGFEVSVAADLLGALLDSVRASAGSEHPDRKPTLAEIERRYAHEVLRATGGNKTRAAEILGIDRKTLYRLIGAIPARAPAIPAVSPDLDPLRRANGT